MAHNLLMKAIVVSAIFATTSAIAGQYVPRSYYVIDKFGHQSDLVYLRTRRALDLHPFVMRNKRGGSYSSASASSSSSSSSGGGGGSGGPIYFGDDFPNSSGSGGNPGGIKAFARPSGNPAAGFEHYNNNAGPTLFSRFGEAEGPGIDVGASASGRKGAFSSSSSVSDGNKVKYSVQSGKY